MNYNISHILRLDEESSLSIPYSDRKNISERGVGEEVALQRVAVAASLEIANLVEIKVRNRVCSLALLWKTFGYGRASL